TNSPRFGKESPSTRRSSAATRSCASSSSRNWKTRATATATSGARRSSTNRPSSSLKTSSPTSRWPSPFRTRATSSAPPSASIATRQGTVKKTPLKDFSNVMARGIIAIGIDKEDELVAARITDGSQIVFLATHLGMAIRFDECDVRSMGRPAFGVRGIDLGKNDYVVGVAITPKEHEEGAYRILAVTENGFGKRTNVEEYRLQTRGGRGVKNRSEERRVGKE